MGYRVMFHTGVPVDENAVFETYEEAEEEMNDCYEAYAMGFEGSSWILSNPNMPDPDPETLDFYIEEV